MHKKVIENPVTSSLSELTISFSGELDQHIFDSKLEEKYYKFEDIDFDKEILHKIILNNEYF